MIGGVLRGSHSEEFPEYAGEMRGIDESCGISHIGNAHVFLGQESGCLMHAYVFYIIASGKICQFLEFAVKMRTAEPYGLGEFLDAEIGR